MLPEFTTSGYVSQFLAQLEDLMGRMNPTFYELLLWLVGEILSQKLGELQGHV